MGANDKTAATAVISTINAVEGFDPSALAVEYTDMNAGEKRKRLPVMAQMAWFRLKYPEGKFTVNVAPGKDCFVATARVYKFYLDPVDCPLAEATASRGYLADKPNVSPREWAQTAALGIALRNAGFGLQFGAAGDSFDDPAVNELGDGANEADASVQTSETDVTGGTETAVMKDADGGAPAVTAQPPQHATSAQPSADPLEAAMNMPCPIGKFKGKTLGEVIALDAGALVWIATKYTGNAEVSAAAKLICESSLAA